MLKMDETWKQRILAVMRRTDVSEEEEFWSLVDAVDGKCTPEVATVLMKSFSSEPDYGTQESVISVLASGDRRVGLRAMIEELPRLAKDAPEWITALMGPEVKFRPEMVTEIAKASSPKARDTLTRVLADEAFCEFYPRAKELYAELSQWESQQASREES
jgi:hypothetical protein